MLIQRLQYQVYTEPLQPSVEIPTLDEWFRPTEIPRFDKKRYQFQYPFFASDELARIPAIPLDEWFQESELPRWDKKRNQYLYPVNQIDPLPILGSFFVNMDSWWTDIVQPRFDKERKQFQYPQLFEMLVYPVAQAASATSIILFKKTRTQYQMWAGPINIQAIVSETLPQVKPRILMSAIEWKPKIVAWHIVPRISSKHTN